MQLPLIRRRETSTLDVRFVIKPSNISSRPRPPDRFPHSITIGVPHSLEDWGTSWSALMFESLASNKERHKT